MFLQKKLNQFLTKLIIFSLITQPCFNHHVLECFLIILFGIIFTCVDPFIQGDWVTGFWTVIGPIFFGSLALGIYTRATKKNKNKN